ncbi:hypothetical protein MD484_g2792, partial [Candolleomyces efflorescens]
MSSFAFIPRNVAKKPPTTLKVNAISGDNPRPSFSQPPKGKQREQDPEPDSTRLSAEESVILLSLAFSEYALWVDVDLRKKLTPLGEEPAFVSLHYLLHHCPVLSPLRGIPQTLIVKHLRTLLPDALDIRLAVTAPQPWFNRAGAASNTQSAGGGYEVRLHSWDPSSSSLFSKSDWDKRTIYVENAPIHYKSIAALVQFLLSLFPAKESSSFTSNRVQGVFLPPHHRDKPGDIPTFKGFALVTFLDEADARHFLEAWPWNPQANSKPAASNNETSNEATKFGFRTTSKSNWEALRAEYLVYRQQLVQEINEHQDVSNPAQTRGQESPSHEDKTLSLPAVKPPRQPKEDEDPPPTNSSAITLSSPYPFGCLVFVKNVHPETNKTTLKRLFGKTLSQSDAGIDYVDFNKGMDTCYLRLSTPGCALYLASHYTEHQTVQTTGLDDTGTSDTAEPTAKPISIEVVLGTREGVYWQKVPEKIRRSAVEKAVQLQGGGDSTEPPSEDLRPKKRRKR